MYYVRIFSDLSFLHENGLDLGQEVSLTAYEIGYSDKALAVKVVGCASVNATPHITIATIEDGDPFDSNKITHWLEFPPMDLLGCIARVDKGTRMKKMLLLWQHCHTAELKLQRV